MPGKGHWLVFKRMQRCTNPRCLQCKDTTARPHGPYYWLQRRDPENWRIKQRVYIGRQEIDDEDLNRINSLFSGIGKPTKEEVLSVIMKTKTAT